MDKKVFVSWSGGKDSYLALLKAQEAGLTISTLVTFFNKNDRSAYHHVNHELMEKQAAAMGFNLETEPVTNSNNGQDLLRVMKRLRATGINGGVFGDINSSRRRKRVERALQQRGCRLLIVSLFHTLIDIKWLGREINDEFILTFKKAGINPCGERGEFHTLAVGGPLFKEPLHIVPREIVKLKRFAYLKLDY